ncbi:MAG: exo-alpha-sialidase [Oscillospiraceae bacterium]|nr:exo-alpha-sialidase [Oscillospiraceae bacterium]
MLITDQEALRRFAPQCRVWQGVPGVAQTRRGRQFVAFYSGGVKEQYGNYCVLTYSDDGARWIDPAAVAYAGEDARCYDPCLWIDPQERLWFFWSVMPRHTVWAAVCDEPDADALQFSAPFPVGHDVMMNKPIVLRSGQWLLPIAVWSDCIRHISVSDADDRRPFVCSSNDNGRTFTRLGGPEVKNRSFDEHMVLEGSDGALWMLIRTKNGLAESRSYDGGVTWLPAAQSAVKGPDSRFHLRRLRSGRILLLNHYRFTGRNNLTAMLSEDEGKTWKGFLLLDERNSVSYPDAAETDGGILIVYDRGRGAYLHSLEEVYASPREILTALVTEEDILAGRLVSPGSYLKRVVNKLGAYDGAAKNPYGEWDRYDPAEYAAELAGYDDGQAVIDRIFADFGYRCMNITAEDVALVDSRLDALLSGECGDDLQKRLYLIRSVVSILRSARLPQESSDVNFIIDELFRVLNETLDEKLTLDELASRLHVSKYYMCHLFRSRTGISIIRYRNARRISRAKELLAQTDLPAAQIAAMTGFNTASYFGGIFRREVGMSPGKYRALHGKEDDR